MVWFYSLFYVVGTLSTIFIFNNNKFMLSTLNLYYVQLGIHSTVFSDKYLHSLKFKPTLDAISGADINVKKLYKSIAKSDMNNLNYNGTLVQKSLDDSQIQFLNRVSDAITHVGCPEKQAIFINKLNGGYFDGVNVAKALVDNTHLFIKPSPEIVQQIVAGVRTQQELDSFITFCDFVSRNELLSLLVVSHKGTFLCGGVLLLQSIPYFLYYSGSFLCTVVSAYDTISYNCTKVTIINFFKITPKKVHVASTIAVSSGVLYGLIYGSPSSITTSPPVEVLKEAHSLYGGGNAIGEGFGEFQRGLITGYFSAMGPHIKSTITSVIEFIKSIK